MRITPSLVALMVAGLVACGTVSEKPAEPAAREQTQAPAPAPAPVPVSETAPAPAPVVTAELPTEKRPAAPARKHHVTKPAKVAKRTAPAPQPAQPAGPTDQEIAAALAYVDEALGRYMLDQVRFTAPSSLQRDATGSAGLVFNSAEAFDKAREAIAGNEQVRKAGIQVSSRVQGRLTGENIDVKAGTPEVQELSGAAPGRWNWQLLPSAEGKAKLHLVVSVDTIVAGGATPRAVHSLDKELVVEAAAAPQGGFLSANWWWLLLLLLLVLVGGYFVARRS